MNKCKRCKGSGKFNNFECVKCSGKGKFLKKDTTLFLIARNPMKMFSFKKPTVIDNHQELNTETVFS